MKLFKHRDVIATIRSNYTVFHNSEILNSLNHNNKKKNLTKNPRFYSLQIPELTCEVYFSRCCCLTESLNAARQRNVKDLNESKSEHALHSIN